MMALVGCVAGEEPPVPVVLEIPADNPNAAQMQRIAGEILESPTREADAVALIEAEGFTARVVERDGEPLPATMDYRIERFNLVITDDQVTGITVG